LDQFCSDAGINDAACGYHSREIVVVDGDVIDEILDQSKKYSCELIIMGAREGLIRETSISHVIRGVLHHSRIPTVVVPPEIAEKK
jgi:nucleotide-binding universal stress UspA family protein